MKMLLTLVTWLLVLGGIVLGYQALMGTNLLHMVLGGFPPIEKIVTILIGFSALFVGYTTITKQA